MGKLCIKCGYERQDADQSPASECPKCGVIYHRAEASAMAARQAQQQLRVIRAKRRQRNYEEDRSVAGIFTFGWMLTPLLCKVGFALVLVLGLWSTVAALADGNTMLAALALLSVFAVRVLLEAVMVVFRLWGDVAEVRSLLTDQAIGAMQREHEA